MCAGASGSPPATWRPKRHGCRLPVSDLPGKRLTAEVGDDGSCSAGCLPDLPQCAATGKAGPFSSLRRLGPDI
jgi:hypothetical protein